MRPALLGGKQKKMLQREREHEKRYFPRWEVHKRVEYIDEDGRVFQSYTKDLTLDGASLCVFGDPPARQPVQLRIYLEGQEKFEARGRVTWSKAEAAFKLIGVVFEGLSKKAQKLIMAHAFELKNDKVSVYGTLKRSIPGGNFFYRSYTPRIVRNKNFQKKEAVCIKK